MSGGATESMTPFVRGMLTVCIMLATIMQALDTTIANVALPYICLLYTSDAADE